jgi:hypothetical protein
LSIDARRPKPGPTGRAWGGASAIELETQRVAVFIQAIVTKRFELMQQSRVLQ